MGKSFWVNVFRFWLGLLFAVVISGSAIAQDDDSGIVFGDLSNIFDFKGLSGMELSLIHISEPTRPY